MQPSSAPDEDVAFIRHALDAGIEQLVAYFDDDGLARAARDADVTVEVHATPNDRAGPNLATIRSGTIDGTMDTFFARLHFYAPSAHGPGLTTSSGEPKDGGYIERLVVHEYSTVFLGLASRRKPEGWRLRTAPAWFVQGYQEYLGLTHSGETGRTRSLPRYVEIVKNDPDRVRNDFGFEVRDPYITGAVLLHFMHERFGADRVRAVLLGAQPTFGRAMREELGVDADAFLADWIVWLEGA
ncbi:MAG: hypothetical protein AAFX79_12180 [Planctomycetota bacterium]